MFTIMSWNVENLFTPDPADRDAFDAKLDALAGVITAEAPDLVGMQEIGDGDAFAALLARLGVLTGDIGRGRVTSRSDRSIL